MAYAALTAVVPGAVDRGSTRPKRPKATATKLSSTAARSARTVPRLPRCHPIMPITNTPQTGRIPVIAVSPAAQPSNLALSAHITAPNAVTTTRAPMPRRPDVLDRNAIAERRRRVAELTRTGMTLRQVAKAVGVTRRTVSRDRVALGITKPPPPPWTQAEDDRALQLLADGCSLRDVSDTLDRNYEAVCYRFRHLGWTNAQTGAYNAMRAWEKRVLG